MFPLLLNVRLMKAARRKLSLDRLLWSTGLLSSPVMANDDDDPRTVVIVSMTRIAFGAHSPFAVDAKRCALSSRKQCGAVPSHWRHFFPSASLSHSAVILSFSVLFHSI